MNRKQILAGVMLAMGCWMYSADAQVPYQFNYQGKLLNGTNLFNGATTMVFRLYNLTAGGSALYVETQAVNVVDGLYSTRVGQSPNFGSLTAASTNQPLYLELQIGSATLTPREQVVSVMYAIKADGVTTGAITTAMLANSAVSGAKLANNAVTGPKIAGGAVSNSHLAVGSVQSNKIDWTQMPAGLQDGDDSVAYQGYAENGTFSATPQASGTDAIAQGAGANAAGNYSAVGGGQYNTNLSSHAVISGGNLNVIESGSQESVIGGGKANIVKTGIWRGTIGGGVANTVAAGATAATVSGGSQNTIEASAGYAAIGGGETNVVQSFASYATIAGGTGNTASGNYATVSGGVDNQAKAAGATVAGGGPNEAKSAYAFIGGGQYNGIGERATNATIAGGAGNRIGNAAVAAAVGGGANNAIGNDSTGASIEGGKANTIGIEADNATIAGGVSNAIADYADCSMIAGGANNYVGSDADWSFAAGQRAKANHSGSFVWADGTGIDFGSSDNNQFLIRASGGVGIGTTNPTPGTLTVRGGLIVTNGVVLGPLTVNGDMVVTNGAYRGNIGPNGGAPFPRPAYDSGWTNIAVHDPDYLRLVHNLGGDVDNYVVDMAMKDGGWGINTVYNGFDRFELGDNVYNTGNWWENLTTNTIDVKQGQNYGSTNVRIRIWVYN